jgi:hypothetical protein
VRRNEPSRLNNSVKRAPINCQIFYDWERSRAKRLDPDGRAVLESPHVNLARGSRFARAVSDSIDHQRWKIDKRQAAGFGKTA